MTVRLQADASLQVPAEPAFKGVTFGNRILSVGCGSFVFVLALATVPDARSVRGWPANARGPSQTCPGAIQNKGVPD